MVERREPGTPPSGPQAPPPLGKRLRIPLNTAQAVARELSRVYRDARGGRLPTPEACRLAYVLDLIRRALETSELALEVAELQAALGGRRR